MCGQPGQRTTAAPAPAPSHVSSACRAALQNPVDSYGGDTHRLLTAWPTSSAPASPTSTGPPSRAHLERPLSDRAWAATAQQFRAMAFDDHVGDAGTLRTDWIEDVLARAGVPGRGHTGQPVAGSPLGGA